MKSNVLQNLLLIASIAATLISCSDDNNSGGKTRFEPIPFTLEEQSTIDATKNFSLNLFRKYNELSEEPNSMIATLGATMDLAMFANGSSGETQSQILTALGFESSDLEAMNAYAERLIKNLNRVDKQTAISLENALFYLSNVDVSATYLDKLRGSYNAECTMTSIQDFMPQIKTWIRARTDGKGSADATQFLQGANLVVLNSLNFDGKWASPFSPAATSRHIFTDINGEANLHDYLCDTARKLVIGQNDTFVCATLNFGNGAYSIKLLLPDEELGIDNCLKTLDADMWNELQKGEEMTVNLRIPKFKMETFSNLTNALMDLGIEDLFNPLKVNFNGVANNNFVIGGISQAVTFSIDENGVKITSVTKGKGQTGSFVVDGGRLFFDRPFLFAITENSSGAILFMGKIGKL